MPTAIKEKVDYDSLKIDPNTYVDQQLQEYYADMVYTAKYISGSHLQLAFLFEHKSYVPQYPHLQLLRYMLNIWEQRIKEDLPLIPIVPMIIYHGQGKWKPKNFQAYFAGNFEKGLDIFLPSFEYLLTNLQEESSSAIRQRFHLQALQMGFLLMKQVRNEKLLDKIEEVLKGMELLYPTEQGRIYLEQVFVYLLSTTKIDKYEVMEKARNISQEAGEFADTIGMKLMMMGMEKGLEKGKQETLNLLVVRMLMKKLDIALITEVLEVPRKKVYAIQTQLKKEGKLQ